MKEVFNYLLISGVLSLMSTTANAKNSLEIGTADIKVQVKSIDRTKAGNILVMLYGRDGFPKDHAKALQIKVMAAVVDQMTVNFSAVPSEFAIKILHDEDDDGKVTKNWTGIFPAEGLGFSNGAKLSLGPPNFDKAKVKLSSTFSPLIINIIYP